MARVMKEIANRTPRTTTAPAIETNSRYNNQYKHFDWGEPERAPH